MKIGITLTEVNYANYPKWIKGNDATIEIVELSYEKKNYQDVLHCDAVVFTGGIDMKPTGNIDYPNAPSEFNEGRDAFELEVLRMALQQKKPILGICRGLQLINVFKGGTLHLDNGSTVNEIHRKENTDKIHSISVDEDSMFHKIVNQKTGEVNSAHHQSIDILGSDLKAVAYSDDNVIEAIESTNPREQFLLAVQWHPERMGDLENPFSKNIRTALIEKIMQLSIINPATGEEITKINQDNEASLIQKFEDLKKGQLHWQAVTLDERIKIILKFSDLLEKNKAELASVLTSEVGKPLQQSINEINGGRARIKWLCDNAPKYLATEYMSEQEDLGEKIVYEPLGVICNISAWNYPYLVGINVIVPALFAGNSVLYKPSEFAVLTGLQIQKLLIQAGVPGDVFEIAVGAANVGAILLEMDFDGYYFTGSYKTGQFIYQKVAPKMVPCQIELGGKDPLYVADDIYDIKNIALGTADGAFYNNGQSCCSVERIYVHEKNYDPYVRHFLEEVKSWKSGLPTEENVYLGPLTRSSQIEVLENQIKDALSKGAKLEYGGHRIDKPGNYFEPTVLTNVTNDMLVMQEESFGPIIGIMKVKNDEEAIALMNDTAYGLTASVYSASQKRAEAILEKVNSGTGYWNCCDRVSPALPWSGRKNSGFGATLSHAGIRAFTKPKAYHLRGQWEK